MLSKLFSTGKAVPPPEPAHRGDPDAALAAILGEVLGLAPDQVRAEPITKGLSSLSLTRFSGPDGPVLVRKSIARDRTAEADFMRALGAAAHPPAGQPGRAWSLPQVHDVVEAEDAVHIFMAFVSGIGHPRQSAQLELAPPLAGAIHDLQRIIPLVCAPRGVALTERGGSGARFLARVRAGLPPDRFARIEEIVALQGTLPRVAAHNDIFWPNFGIAVDGGRHAITFIDFGMIGSNVAGADLHHFARVAIRSAGEMAFFRELSRCYGEVSGIDRDLVEMNAYFYAAQRLVAHEAGAAAGTGGVSEASSRLLQAAAESHAALRKRLRASGAA